VISTAVPNIARFLCEIGTLSVCDNVIALQAYGVVDFLFRFAVPVSVFAYCYGRIFQSIRAHNKVISGHSVHGQDITMASTSRDLNAGEIQRQATANTGAKLSHTELNVLQTMVSVIICFLICWSVLDIANFLERIGVSMSITYYLPGMANNTYYLKKKNLIINSLYILLGLSIMPKCWRAAQ